MKTLISSIFHLTAFTQSFSLKIRTTNLKTLFQRAFSATSKATKITTKFLCFQFQVILLMDFQITLPLERCFTFQTFKGSFIGMSPFVLF
jgi:hypothetical protein